MEPFLVLALGAAVLGGGVLLLLSFGEAFRTARLIQTTPAVSHERAIELAASGGGAAGPGTYVRIHGRVDSDDAFPDEQRRPLVYRRTRLQVRRGRRWPNPFDRTWQTVDERVEAVPFEVRSGMLSVRVRTADIGSGLVVIPRESSGTASEIPDRVPEGVPAAARVRLVVEQLSAVEHVSALGVVRQGEGGVVELAAGPNRPLVLTPLEDDEAMRILAADSPRRPAAVAGLLVSGLGLLAIGTAWLAIRALAAA